MEAESFNRALRAFVARRPFQPFTVELDSGPRLRVDHPEALVFRGGVAVHFATDWTMTLFDNQSVAQLTSAVDAPTRGSGTGTEQS